MLPKYVYTAFGIIALLLWGTGTYCFKMAINYFGLFSGLAYIRTASGVCGMLIFILSIYKNGKIQYDKFTKLSKESTIVISLLVLNSISNGLFYAIPPPGEVLLQCAVVGYIWTLLLNILLVYSLNYKIISKLGFYFGLLFGLCGITIACVGFDFKTINFIKYFEQYYYCYFLAIVAAITWAYYSVYLAKFKQFVEKDHTFIGLLITGILLFAASVASPDLNNYQHTELTFKSLGFLIYTIIMASMVPYTLWNIGYSKGSSKVIANFSLLSPIINIVTTQLIYGLPLYLNIIIGAIILIIAMACCKYSIEKPENNISDNAINDFTNVSEIGVVDMIGICKVINVGDTYYDNNSSDNNNNTSQINENV